jgi:hypothetical protein
MGSRHRRQALPRSRVAQTNVRQCDSSSPHRWFQPIICGRYDPDNKRIKM